MGRVAWGGDGSMYRRSCEASNYGYCEQFNFDSNKWDQLGNEYAYEVTADSTGNPWIVSKGLSEPIKKWDRIDEKWLDMGLNDAYNTNAGPGGHVYGTAPPNVSGG